MKTQFKLASGLAILLAFSLSSPVLAQQKKAKAKAQKVSGSVGLLDTEKNYLIVVTKEGKLVTIDYNDKTKVTALVPKKAKISDVGLGSAASVQYTKQGDKNHLSAIEFVSKKKGK